MKNILLKDTVIIFFSLMWIASCEGKQGEYQAESTQKEFFEVHTPTSLLSVQKELKLSELADSVRYIPLETSDSLLLGDVFADGICRFVDSEFYIFDGQQHSIYVFSAEGRFKNKIGRKGQGPNDIYRFLDFTADGERVYIADFGSKLHRFQKDGTNLGYVTLPKQAYKLMSPDSAKLACFITDDQFEKNEEAYSWLMVNTEGDSVSCLRTPDMRKVGKENALNHYVLHDFSANHPFTYKEAYNDSLYYFTTEGGIRAYAHIDLGVHKIEPSLSFDEIMKEEHAIRLSRIYDLPRHLIVRGTCFCVDNQQHWWAWDKQTGDFFHLQDEKIKNDFGGPDFSLFACASPGWLIGIAEPMDCSETFLQQYNLKEDDNPILIMVRLNPV